MERLRCVVERITYQNGQNGYSVIKCAAKGYNDLVTVVGTMPDVHVGSVLSLTGTWKDFIYIFINIYNKDSKSSKKMEKISEK